MDIAAVASSLSSQRLATEVSARVFKMALDIQETTSQQLVQALNPPHLGQNIDVSV